jgi:hypothetical protein
VGGIGSCVDDEKWVGVAGMLEPYEYIKAEPAKEDGTDGETELEATDYAWV